MTAARVRRRLAADDRPRRRVAAVVVVAEAVGAADAVTRRRVPAAADVPCRRPARRTPTPDADVDPRGRHRADRCREPSAGTPAQEIPDLPCHEPAAEPSETRVALDRDGRARLTASRAWTPSPTRRHPVNEPNLTYAPGSPERDAARAELDAAASAAVDLTATSAAAGGSAAAPRSRRAAARPPARARASLKDATQRRRRGGDQGRGGRGSRLAGDVVRRPGGDPAQGGRPAGRPVAPAAQRRHHARPVQDRVPGRDRRGLRADRLLAVQRPLRPADPRRAADRQQPRHLEPHRPPPARGLRLRDHAVQLHRDRRQPADRAGADGQHRDLEAVADPAARGAPDHGAARGGRAAAGRHQHAARRRARRLRGRARATPTWPASTSPARRRRSSTCGARSARTSRPTAPTRASSARPAARTSWSRTRPPTPTCCAPR